MNSSKNTSINLFSHSVYLFYLPFLLWGILFSTPIAAQEKESSSLPIVIHLADSTGGPIAGVSLTQRGKGVIAISNSKGVVQLRIKKPIVLQVTHPNFLPLERTILLDSNASSLHWTMQRNPQFLDVVTVTGSALPKQLRKISSSVSILSKDAPELRQVQTIDEALAFIPGVMVDRSRGLTTTGTHTGVILRGTGSANRTLVLKDGVPINDAYTGGVSEWNTLPANSIARVEVVRGPGSSIYGSSSMGGTINLVTQSPTDKPTIGASVRYGSMNTLQANIKAGGRFAKRWGIIAFAEYKRTDGYAYMADSLWKDHFRKPKMSLFNLNTKLSYDLEQGGRITATADFNLQEPMSGTSTLYDDQTVTGNYQIRYQNEGMVFKPDILLYYNVQNRSSEALGWHEEDNTFSTVNYSSRVPLDTYGMIAKVSHRIWHNDITLGADLRFTEVVSKKRYPNKGEQNFSGRQDFISFFVNDDISLTRKLYANLGMRFDYWSNGKGHFFDNMSEQEVVIDYGDATSKVLTPKIGLTYQVSENLRLRSMYATGFRAPGAFYMYNAAPLGSSFRLGNPALKPERMRHSIELGADLELMQKLELSATIYSSQYSDFLAAVLIEAAQVPPYFDPGDLPVRQYINIGKVNLWGLESSLKYRFSSFLSMQLSYFHNESEIKKYESNPAYQGKAMSDNPRNIYSGAFIYDSAVGHLSLWGRHTGAFFGDLENSLEKKMDPVTVVDVKMAKSFGPIGINFTVNNLLDKQYYGSYTSATSYYYAPGRTFFFGVQYQY